MLGLLKMIALCGVFAGLGLISAAVFETTAGNPGSMAFERMRWLGYPSVQGGLSLAISGGVLYALLKLLNAIR